MKQKKEPGPERTDQKDRPLFAFFVLVVVGSGNALVFKASQKSGTYAYNTSSAIAVTEAIKLLMSLTTRWKNAPDGAKLIHRGVTWREYGMWLVLAALYAVNNQLSFLLLKALGPGQLVMGKSFAPMQTAILMKLLFGGQINKIQWACIALTVAGLIGVLGKQEPSSSNPLSPRVSEETPQFGTWGVLLASCTMTAFCSVFNSKLVRGSDTPLAVQNIILYSFGLIFNLIMYCSGMTPSTVPGFFTGYASPVVLMMLFSQSMIGLAITYVYKHGGAIVKTLASGAVGALLASCDGLFFGVPLTQQRMAGVVTVLVASYLYFEAALKVNSSTGQFEPPHRKV